MYVILYVLEVLSICIIWKVENYIFCRKIQCHDQNNNQNSQTFIMYVRIGVPSYCQEEDYCLLL